MGFRKLEYRWRYRHCSEIGVKDDYMILQFRFREGGWTTVATCHTSAIQALKEEGIKARLDLVKFASGY